MINTVFDKAKLSILIWSLEKISSCKVIMNKLQVSFESPKSDKKRQHKGCLDIKIKIRLVLA